jgi:hypothetical protein
MVKDPNPGFVSGIAKRTPLQRLAWALKGAEGLRKKDLRLSAMAAIAEGREIRERVTDLVLRAGADPEDARVYCVFVNQAAFAEPPEDADAETIDSFINAPRVPRLARLRVKDDISDFKLAAEFREALPIGFLIFVWDRNDWARNDPGRYVIPSIRPLIIEHSRATGLNAFAMREEKKAIEKHLKKAAGVLSDDEDLCWSLRGPMTPAHKV